MATRRKLSTEDHVNGLKSGDRASLARTITLIESSNPEHQKQAQQVLTRIMPDTGRSIRLGISGVPGVGKSTTIEALGCHLIEQGHRVAVLAIDPSSTRTGGSILGDKTRMTRLSTSQSAYIRPSPTTGTLGGVARATRETLLLCEAAGFDIVLVETVGVGQSEVTLASMVDCYLLLMLPGAGDELQGIKKGVLEIADILAVNKADPDNPLPAEQAAAAYQRALHILRSTHSNWQIPVMTFSALHDLGVSALWQKVLAFQQCAKQDNSWHQRRESQQIDWMRSLVQTRILDRLHQDESLVALARQLEQAVRQQQNTPVVAADQLVRAYFDIVGSR